MGLIGVFFLAVLGIFGAAISRQLSDEFKAWTPWLINYLIRRAVRQLPEEHQERCGEEWRSHANEIPGEVGKLIHALSCSWASWKISKGLADDIFYLIAKRTIDVGCAVSLFPFFCTSVAIFRLGRKGPIFIMDHSQGHRNNTICILTFRATALEEESNVPLPLNVQFLHRSDLKRLPLLLNVLSGEMAFIGPRLLRSFEIKMIEEQLPQYSRRKNVKPGLFGLAEASGCFEVTAPTLEELQRELEYDLYYIDNRSFMLDLKILLMALWQS